MHVHSHAGHHHPGQYGGRLLVSVVLNLAISIAQFIGGIVSGSLALLSDALHNFSDTASLAVSYGAGRVAAREATQHRTFGYRRAEIIGAFVNLVTLVLIAVWLIAESVERLFDPVDVRGSIMMWVAVGGLLANLITALLLHRGSKENLNLRSAFLHVVTDTVSSVAVVGGGLLIMWYGVTIVDPILSAAIALFILVQSVGLLRRTVDILMETAPRDLDVPGLAHSVRAVEGVVDMHHVHVWQLDEHRSALEAHIVVRKHDMLQMECIKHAVKVLLNERFGIEHSTLEFEFEPCLPTDADCFEHEPDDALRSGELS